MEKKDENLCNSFMNLSAKSLANTLSNTTKIATISEKIKNILEKDLNLNLGDENLKGTPHRIAKMWINDFCANVDKKFNNFKLFLNESQYDQMIISSEIPFSSVCSHHFIHFSGKAWFGYIPNKFLIGKSKISRLIDFHCKKPQLQENLGEEIVEDFVFNVRPLGCMLIMKAVHNCEFCRGATKYAPMVTSVIRGNFDDNKVRNEMLQLISLK